MVIDVYIKVNDEHELSFMSLLMMIDLRIFLSIDVIVLAISLWFLYHGISKHLQARTSLALFEILPFKGKNDFKITRKQSKFNLN